jgi:hypothetical protein
MELPRYTKKQIQDHLVLLSSFKQYQTKRTRILKTWNEKRKEFLHIIREAMLDQASYEYSRMMKDFMWLEDGMEHEKRRKILSIWKGEKALQLLQHQETEKLDFNEQLRHEVRLLFLQTLTNYFSEDHPQY